VIYNSVCDLFLLKTFCEVYEHTTERTFDILLLTSSTFLSSVV